MNPIIVGWREFIELPTLCVTRIKAKVDTGAKTSCLHVTNLQYLEDSLVEFNIHPHQRSPKGKIKTRARVFSHRYIRNSGGNAELRPIIKSLLKLGEQTWEIELSLANRELMGFRMLLGREALRHRVVIDPNHSFLTSQTLYPQEKEEQR